MGPIVVLLNKVFPCFHFLVKPLLHTSTDYFINFFFVERPMECYLIVTCANFSFVNINNKEKPNTEKEGNYERLTCEEFSKLYDLLIKGIKFLQY